MICLLSAAFALLFSNFNVEQWKIIITCISHWLSHSFYTDKEVYCAYSGYTYSDHYGKGAVANRSSM